MNDGRVIVGKNVKEIDYVAGNKDASLLASGMFASEEHDAGDVA